MNVEKLHTVEEWVTFYRQDLALPVTERGGFVMLPVTVRLAVVHLPLVRAERVRESLAQQGIGGPVLARQIRWSFLVTPDGRPGPQVLDVLNRLDIGIPAAGSAIMLPTGLGRWTREGCHWVVPPGPGTELPPLSVVITTALAVGSGGED